MSGRDDDLLADLLLTFWRPFGDFLEREDSEGRREANLGDLLSLFTPSCLKVKGGCWCWPMAYMILLSAPGLDWGFGTGLGPGPEN